MPSTLAEVLRPLLAGLALWAAGISAQAQPAPAVPPTSADHAASAASAAAAGGEASTPAASAPESASPSASAAASGPAADAAADAASSASTASTEAASEAASGAASDTAADLPVPPSPASDPASDVAASAAPAGSGRPSPPGAPASGVSFAPRPGVEGPRAYGHVIGDVLTQRLLLPAYTDAPAASVLPPAGRVGRWFERRPPVVETDGDGRRWLRLDYQVVNAPREPQVASLPALSLAVGSDTLSLPAWPVGLGPMTVAADRLGGLPAWREDRPWPAQETPAMTRRLHDTLLAFAALLLAWAGWWAWREWRHEAELPFARAWRVLRRAQASDPEAWRTLHRAIDATAGRVVHAASLPALLAERPALQPLREPLEGFYRASAARFFDGRGDTDGFPLRELARSLRRVERAEHH